ncbi:serine hydrolase domain-containing protein [Sphingomonas fuzhouensis]|uniref:serine hydrolase domain-containing protein n=1 Tax=Sphingomonas fuzhouensis TaxID=3106033 RepID=UPI002AFE5CAC|nr:serine hydrolase domain-containing protein [Sphingomonas sp. SGZ-02]
MILTSAMMILAQAATPSPATQSGDWLGTLTLPSRATLRIAVHFSVDRDGILRGSFDSLDQRSWNTPLDAIMMTSTTLTFTVPSNGSRYTAHWDAMTRRWVGVWSQGGAQLPLSLAAGGPPPRSVGSEDAWTLPSDAEICEILDRRIAQRPGEAIVVGVIDAGGRRIVARGPAKTDTLSEIGSITKVFTGLLLADMAARGEVGLNDPAAKYLPAGWTLPVRGRPITLLDLATHRSGLPRLPLNLPFADEGNPYADYTPALMREFLKSWVPDREPGAAYEYSNLGVALLGQILAQRAGTDYATLVRTRITAPLHMDDTRIRHARGDMRLQATPHDEYLRPVAPWDDSVMAPAGGLRSDAGDMLDLLAANLGFIPTSLKPAMDMMQVIRAEGDGPKSAMGIGWMINTTRVGRVVTHGGATGGYLARIAFDPVRRRGVVALANAMTQPGVDDIAMHLLTGSPIAAAPPPAEPPAARPFFAIPPAGLDRFIGRYRLAPDQVITVFRSKDRLMIQLIGQQALPIRTSGPLAFFGTIVPFDLTFHEAAGTIDAVTLRQNGEETVAPRIAEP